MSQAPARVAILDAGSQFGKLIDRRLHDIGIECDIIPLNTPTNILNKKYGAAVISGSPGSVNAKNAPSLAPDFFEKYQRPVLGICYGLQLINKLHGGKVESVGGQREDGQFTVNLLKKDCIFQDIENEEIACLLTHGDQITELSDELECIGTAETVIAALRHKTRKIYAVQFHPEVDLTPMGKTIFKTFITKIACLPCTFTIDAREEQCLKEIRDTVGDKNLVVLVSGGVDSSVLTALCKKALGANASQQLFAIHIDQGLMRHEESSKVKVMLQQLDIKLKVVRAGHIFLSSKTKVKIPTADGKGTFLQDSPELYSTIEPEHKRKIIGDTFIRVTTNEMYLENLELNDCFIAQGTLRPDLIESASCLASSSAETIKTHHNDTQLVRDLRAQGKVVEPLKDFHKDQVRELGKRLGLPQSFIERHPFPGPGLGIRIICHQEGSDSHDKLRDIILKSDEENTPSMIKTFVRYKHASENTNAVYKQLKSKLNPRDEKTLLKLTARYPKISAVLLPFRTVGVQGDGRSYKLCAALSYKDSVSSGLIQQEQFWKDLYEIAKCMPTVLTYVNRVVFLYGDKAVDETPNFTTNTRLTLDTIDQLRQADHICTELLREHNCYNRLSQMPVVSLPIDFEMNEQIRLGFTKSNNTQAKRSICIRPFLSNDFMTGIPGLPIKDISLECFEDMAQKTLKQVHGISRFMIDLTPKPPGTTEWE